MPLHFRIRSPGTGTERPVQVEPSGGELTIGRHAGVEVELPFASVSGRHLRISRQGTGWVAADLGSANGSWVKGQRLPARAPVALQVGDELRLADVVVIFDGDGAPPPGAGPESTATLARRLVSDLFGVAPDAEVARIVVGSGPTRGQALRLLVVGQSYRIGRAPHCELVLADDDVSREHAVIERRFDGVHVRDLGSKNGVIVDGTRITNAHRARDGARMVLGATELLVEDPEERYLARVRAADEGPPAAAPTPEAAPKAPRRSAAPLLVSVVAVLALFASLAVGVSLLAASWK